MCMKNKQRSRNETLRLQRFGRSSGRTGCYDITRGRSSIGDDDQETKVSQLGSGNEPDTERSALSAAD